MRKKITSQLLAALMLLSLLSGCSQTPAETSTPASPTEKPGLDDTPNVVNGVYATCENYDFNWYTVWNTKTISFWLITEKPLPADASIVLNDVQSEIDIWIQDKTEEQGSKIMPDIFWWIKEPEKDWRFHWSEQVRLEEEIKQLKKIVYGSEKPGSGAVVLDQDAYAKLKETYDAYYKVVDNPYLDEVVEYRKSVHPICYCYEVSLNVKEVVRREQIKSMELIAGDMSRTITMKNVWLDVHSTRHDAIGFKDGDSVTEWTFTGSIEGDNDLIQNSFPDHAIAAMYPYGDGDFKNNSRRKFILKEDVLLKDAYIYGDNSRIKVERIELLVMNSQNQTVHITWTPGTDLLLRKGEKVVMQMYYSDPHTQQMNYCFSGVTVVEYECGGETKQYSAPLFIRRQIYAPELYLWAFKGLDLRSYYEGYWYPYQVRQLSD